jgi:hypothetical protein
VVHLSALDAASRRSWVSLVLANGLAVTIDGAALFIGNLSKLL